jgi:hypothetical protein
MGYDIINSKTSTSHIFFFGDDIINSKAYPHLSEIGWASIYTFRGSEGIC